MGENKKTKNGGGLQGSEKKLKVVLLRHTEEPELTIATAGHLCYAGIGIEELQKKMDKPRVERMINQLVSSGHFSVLEHANFTFGIEGVSRACTHQLVRHRLASYAQQSQRYVDEKNFAFIVPPKVKENKETHKKFLAHMEECKRLYGELAAAGIPKEDARFVLPNAAETRIIVTMNARSLMNFFERRLCTRAQWEIRELANAMLEELKKAAPLLFGSAGPACERLGYCPEAKSCGRYPLRNEVIKGVS